MTTVRPPVMYGSLQGYLPRTVPHREPLGSLQKGCSVHEQWSVASGQRGDQTAAVVSGLHRWRLRDELYGSVLLS